MSEKFTWQHAEPAIRGKLEDWEDAIDKSIDKVIEAEVRGITEPTDGAGFIKALGLLNGGKDWTSTFLPRAGAFLGAPEIAVPLAVMTKVGSLLRLGSDDDKRKRLVAQEYARVRTEFMEKVRLAEDTFPSSKHGMELAKRIEKAAFKLEFRSALDRTTWCLRFIANLGAIEVHSDTIEKQLRDGFKPVFKKMGIVIKGSLTSDVGKIPRWLGADPKWKWSGFHLHVPGTHTRGRGVEWPGSVKTGFRRATENEIRDIMTNLWKYKITTRQLLVGTGYVSSFVTIVEVQPIPKSVKELPVPDIGPALDKLFDPIIVANVKAKTAKELGAGVVDKSDEVSGVFNYYD